MARSVFTGWRTVTPGPCAYCGFDSDYEVDGRGTVYCSCMTCPECAQFDGHNPGCEIAEAEGREDDELPGCPECGFAEGHDSECGAITDDEADAIYREAGCEPPPR
jgi:hypothetical protein